MLDHPNSDVPGGRVTIKPRLPNVAGALAPLVFIGFWVACGLITAADYSPIDDAISRLAAVDSDVRWGMTTGFVLFGLLMIYFAQAVESKFGPLAAWAVRVNGLATLAVAATPLDASSAIDQLHNVSAVTGYVSLAAIPVAAYSTLTHSGHVRLAKAGLAVAGIAAVSLSVSALGLPTGLFQRIGLTSVDLWVSAFAGVGFMPARRG